MNLFERLENIDRKLDSLLRFHTANFELDDPTILSEEELSMLEQNYYDVVS